MGVLDKLTSRADRLAQQRLDADNRRAGKRPEWLPDDHPDGVPFVSLAAAYAGAEVEQRTDCVTTRVVDPEADVRLNDEQVAGWHVEAELAARRTAANELRDLVRRTVLLERGHAAAPGHGCTTATSARRSTLA